MTSDVQNASTRDRFIPAVHCAVSDSKPNVAIIRVMKRKSRPDEHSVAMRFRDEFKVAIAPSMESRPNTRLFPLLAHFHFP